MSGLEPLLHVEDDALVARALSRVLKARGYELVRAACCAEARAVQDSYRLGIFDVDLLDGDGVELASELRSRGIVQCVVFLTGTLDSNAVARAREVGEVVVKSSDLSLLLAALGEPRMRSEYPVSPRPRPGSNANTG
jgi:DNA-binding response OmpR family regulator